MTRGEVVGTGMAVAILAAAVLAPDAWFVTEVLPKTLRSIN